MTITPVVLQTVTIHGYLDPSWIRPAVSFFSVNFNILSPWCFRMGGGGNQAFIGYSRKHGDQQSQIGRSSKWMEISATQFFEFLPALFDGLGLQANFTYTDSQDKNGNVVGGISEQVYNVIAFYEKKDFGNRLTFDFRDKFNDSPNRGITGRWTDANSRLDLSVFYILNEQLIVTLKGINPTDEGYRSFLDGFENRINTYEQTGTRWLAGIRFRF